MKRLGCGALVVVLLGFASTARADDPSGTWKWSVERGGQTVETTLKLKLEGDKLTGAVVGNNNQETAIGDATFKDGEVSFTVTRERNNQKFVTKYKGKLSGDSIKGKAESERNGQVQSRDWEAKRAK